MGEIGLGLSADSVCFRNIMWRSEKMYLLWNELVEVEYGEHV